MSVSRDSDPNNPSGALPGDPRHGLSEEQLKEYYSGLGPSWIVHAVLRTDGGAEAADAVLDEHLAYLRSERDQIRFAGPSLADDATTKVGSIWLIDADDRTIC